ncbi:MAG: cupin domain-containing protein [Candidatus Ranarchaeia archaeon]
MIKISSGDVPLEQVTKAGSKKTMVQWLITDEIGAPNFAMRRYIIEAGGYVGLHSHIEEHEVYVLSGSAEFSDGTNVVVVRSGDAVFIPPNEPHMINNVGNKKLEFICIIPGANKR